MTSFEENLVAGVIVSILTVGLTVGLINKIIKDREKKAWEPARRSVIEALVRRSEFIMFGWAVIHQSASSASIVPSDTDLSGVVPAFREEVDYLSGNNDRLAMPRDEGYWRRQLRNILDDREAMSVTLARVQVTLRDEPNLVRSITDFEQSLLHASEMNRFLEEESDAPLEESFDVAKNVAVVAGAVFAGLLDMRDQCVSALNE
jgi:hypothetical protein